MPVSRPSDSTGRVEKRSSENRLRAMQEHATRISRAKASVQRGPKSVEKQSVVADKTADESAFHSDSGST